MSKKSSRQKQQKPTGHKEAQGGNKLDHKPDNVNVTGKIETDFPPKLIEKFDAAGNKQEAWDRKKFWAEIITIILLLAYTSVATWQGCLTRDLVTTANKTFDAANRPYVGVDAVQASHIAENAGGEPIKSTVRTKETKNLDVTALIKNFGPVPGTNFTANSPW